MGPVVQNVDFYIFSATVCSLYFILCPHASFLSSAGSYCVSCLKVPLSSLLGLTLHHMLYSFEIFLFSSLCFCNIWNICPLTWHLVHFSKCLHMIWTFYQFYQECNLTLPSHPIIKTIVLGTSLVVQWLRIRLPMQRTWVQALVREDPTCCGATKPVRHNY